MNVRKGQRNQSIHNVSDLPPPTHSLSHYFHHSEHSTQHLTLKLGFPLVVQKAFLLDVRTNRKIYETLREPLLVLMSQRKKSQQT